MITPQNELSLRGIYSKVASISLFIYFALTQTSNGTYFIASKTEQYVVVSIDTRVVSITREVGAITNDRDCKILRLSPEAFFFDWGVAGDRDKDGRVIFDPSITAHQTFDLTYSLYQIDL